MKPSALSGIAVQESLAGLNAAFLGPDIGYLDVIACGRDGGGQTMFLQRCCFNHPGALLRGT